MRVHDVAVAPVERLRARLQGVRISADGFVARCPAHDDRNASLSISEGDDGRALVHCFAGCDMETILSALGLTPSDLFLTTSDGTKRARVTTQKSALSTYVYRNGGQQPVFRVVREAGKQFFQQHPDGRGGWLNGLGEVEPVLYLLPGLSAAPRDEWIFFPEGEKDADRLAALGLVATASAMGASAKWRDSYTDALSGRRIIMLADNDGPGWKRVETAAQALHGHAAEVKVIGFPDLKPGGDVSDWLDAGHAVEELRALVEQTSEWKPGATLDEDVGQPAELMLRTRRASDIEPLEVDWLWQGWLPAGMLGLLAGRGGSGKSTVALWIAAQCSVGGTLPDGQPAPLLNTLIFAAEDSPAHTIIPRLIAMSANLDRIHIVEGVAREGDDPDHVQVRAHAALIEREVDRLDIGLVIIDPIASYLGAANSDKESDVRAGLMPLVALAERTRCAVLMIRHVSKAGDSGHAGTRILGSTAFRDVPRVTWMLADAPDEYQPDPHEDGTRDVMRVLGVDKSNLAVKPASRMCIQPVDGPQTWKHEPSPVTIDECFFSQPDQGSKSREAKTWLADYLQGGSKRAVDVDADAKDAGISRTTLRRAKDKLKIKPFKDRSATGAWYWQLPPGDEINAVEEVNTLHNVDSYKDAHSRDASIFPPSSEDTQGAHREHLQPAGATQIEGAHPPPMQPNGHLQSFRNESKAGAESVLATVTNAYYEEEL